MVYSVDLYFMVDIFWALYCQNDVILRL